MVQIYTTDATIRTAEFVIKIRSTITEETSWADFTDMVINYVNPSTPSTSTIETYFTQHEAGTAYTWEFQSRNWAGTAVTWPDDDYTITLTQSDGRGSTVY